MRRVRCLWCWTSTLTTKLIYISFLSLSLYRCIINKKTHSSPFCQVPRTSPRYGSPLCEVVHTSPPPCSGWGPLLISSLRASCQVDMKHFPIPRARRCSSPAVRVSTPTKHHSPASGKCLALAKPPPKKGILEDPFEMMSASLLLMVSVAILADLKSNRTRQLSPTRHTRALTHQSAVNKARQTNSHHMSQRQLLNL